MTKNWAIWIKSKNKWKRNKKLTLERVNELLTYDYSVETHPEIHYILSEFIPWYCRISGYGYGKAYKTAKELEQHYNYNFCKYM